MIRQESHTRPRFEKVEGVRNLYRDHGSNGSPYVVRYKENGSITKNHVLGVMSQKDAILRRDEFFVQPVQARPSGPPIRCDKAWQTWYDARTSKLHQRPLSAATAKRYRGLWRNHAKGVLGNLRVRDVKVEHIAAVFTRMQAQGLDPNNAYVMLSSFFKAMTVAPYGYRPDNPVQYLGELKPPAPSSDAVSEEAVIKPEEMEQILGAINSKTRIDRQMRQTLIRLSYLTGLRLSETLGLVWTAIDLEAGEIHVERQLAIEFSAGEPESWFAMVKGNKTKVGSTARIVPLDDEAWALLREHRTWVFENGLYRGPESLVFPTKKHTPIRQSGISEVFSVAVDRGFRAARYPFTFHCLRHSFASREFGRGASIEEVARLLGHSSDVTQKRYVHLVDRQAYNEAFRARRRFASV